MLTQKSKRMKSGGRVASLIAQCLAYGTYSAVVTPSADESVRELQPPNRDPLRTYQRVSKQLILMFPRVPPYPGNRTFITE